MFAIEESKVAVRVSHVINRLDDVIKVVNTQAADSYQLDQSVQDIQQELITLRQTVESWNDDQQHDEVQVVVGFSSVNDTLEMEVSTGLVSSAIKRLSMSTMTGESFSFILCMS